jgi:hypothetical protein
MISMFTMQMQPLRQGNYGQATVLLLTTIVAILSVVFMAAYIGYLGAAKVASANAVDAIALSAATWEARGLNLIAGLNDGILQCLRLIRWTCVLWAAMAIAACFGLGLPVFLDYSKRAARIIRSAWDTALRLAQWSEKIRDAIPFLILAETGRLSRELKVTGVLHPFDPGGPHDHDRTLELHLTHGPPITLVDALSPLHKVKQKIRKWKWAKKISGRIVGIIDSTLHSVLDSGLAAINMLVPEDDLPDRQKVRFAGFRVVSPVPIPFFSSNSRYRFYSQSSAEPYGGGATEMSWRSRLTEWRKER